MSKAKAKPKMNGRSELEINEDKQDLLRQVSEYKESIRLERSKNLDNDMSTMCKKEAEVSLLAPVMNMKCRKVLKGHRGRMLHFDWSADRSHVITAGQDGYALIWDSYTGQKETVIQTTSPWVLACSYAPSTTMVACGGFENQCSIYKLEPRTDVDPEKVTRISHPSKTVAQHSKHISHCTFFGSDQQLLTSSADSTCALWDVELEDPVQTFKGHRTEVLGLSLHPGDPYTIFASGGCDGHTCIWDVRSGSCEMKFNQDSAVNAVKFFPSGDSVASAGNDGIIHLYDLRADQEIRLYSKPSIVFGASAVDFSKSGRILFAGYDDYSIRAWDVLKGTHLTLWLHHQDRVSHLLLSPDGTALGTASWDGTLKIMA